MRRRGTTAADPGLLSDPAHPADTAAAALSLLPARPGRQAIRSMAQSHPGVTVAAFAVPVLVVKLVLAARTFGTKDMVHWADFTAGVRAAGPVGIYGVTFPDSFYNHPPLMGYVLWVVNGLQDLGVWQNFTIRALASLADVGSAFLLLALLRRRRPLAQATWAAVLLAVSPVLLLVSGFHGNTDPDFVFLTLLGVYLLVDRRLPLYAGVALALAIGVKIVPMVVLPALAVHAWKRGGRTLPLLAVGFLATFALTWGPALLSQFGPVKAHVIGYAGNGYSLWGIMQIGHWLGDPGWVAVLGGPGRIVLVAVCGAVPALAVWRRPDVVLPAVAWSLLMFLTFATTFGVQYLVWAVAVAYLVNPAWATIYNISAGVVLAVIYNRWSGGVPWDYADPTLFTTGEKIALQVPWVALLALSALATMAMVRGGVDQRRGAPHPATKVDHRTGPHPTAGNQIPIQGSQ